MVIHLSGLFGDNTYNSIPWNPMTKRTFVISTCTTILRRRVATVKTSYDVEIRMSCLMNKWFPFSPFYQYEQITDVLRYVSNELNVAQQRNYILEEELQRQRHTIDGFYSISPFAAGYSQSL